MTTTSTHNPNNPVTEPTKRRVRLRAQQFFLSRDPTPVPSNLYSIRDFQSSASHFQRSHLGNLRCDIPAHVKQECTDIMEDGMKWKDRFFGRLFRHLLREREHQLLEAERTRRTPKLSQRTSGGTGRDSVTREKVTSTAKMTSKIASICGGDTASAEGADDGATTTTGTRSEIVDEFETEMRDMLGISSDSLAAAMSVDSTSSDKPMTFGQLSGYLATIKTFLQNPALSSLNSRNLSGSSSKKILEESPNTLIPTSCTPASLHNLNGSVEADGNSLEGTSVLQIAIYPVQKPLSKSHEFLVSSEATLSDFRDALYCPIDEWPPLSQESRRHSAYFFIEGTFYNDLRHPDALDYSKEVIEWWTRRGDDADSTRLFSSTMHGTKFKDLDVRIGYPYIYTHQGNCNHVFLIKQISLFDQNKHPATLASKPVKLFERVGARPTCRYCEVMPVSKITMNDEMCGFYPGLFCERCFADFHSCEDPHDAGYSVYDYISASCPTKEPRVRG